MRIREILNRLNGISTPIGGVSWTPPALEIETGRRVVAFLEDRRVLYNPNEIELPRHCVQSVIQMRHFLTAELGQLDHGVELAAHLRAMRAACRKFLDQLPDDIDAPVFGLDHFQGWVFISALGELRGAFGQHLLQIAAAYELDIEEPLASILPVEDLHEAEDRPRRRND